MATATDSVSVIGSQFISPNPLQLKIETYSYGKLVITDTDNKIILKVKPCDSTFHSQRLILDANDNPIVKLRKKGMSAHEGWNVFRGESKADSDIISRTRNNHMIQFKVCVNVYLGSKISCKDDYNFQIKGSWSKRSFSIYKGDDSSTPIAQTNMKGDKDTMMVTINPNVDYAFVVALIAIVDAMNSIDPKKAKSGSEVGGGVIDIMSAMASA